MRVYMLQSPMQANVMEQTSRQASRLEGAMEQERERNEEGGGV